MLPDPIPYFESESLSLRWHLFLLASCFLVTFSSVSIFSLTVQKSALWDWVSFRLSWGLEVGFFHSIFLKSTTILGIVSGKCAPIFLAQVAMLLGASFLGSPAHRIGARSLVTPFPLVRKFLNGLCIGSSLGTCTLNSLKRQEKQMHLHGFHTFLVKVKLVLPCVWAHPKNMTC